MSDQHVFLEPGFRSLEVKSHLVAAAAAAASLRRICRMSRSMWQICRRVIFGAWRARVGGGAPRGP